MDHLTLWRERAGACAGATASTQIGINNTGACALVDYQGWLSPARLTGIGARWKGTLFADAYLGQARCEIVKVDADAREFGIAFFFVGKGTSDLALTASQAARSVYLDVSRSTKARQGIWLCGS